VNSGFNSFHLWAIITYTIIIIIIIITIVITSAPLPAIVFTISGRISRREMICPMCLRLYLVTAIDDPLAAVLGMNIWGGGGWQASQARAVHCNANRHVANFFPLKEIT
jgi:hypothetical protein